MVYEGQRSLEAGPISINRTEITTLDDYLLTISAPRDEAESHQGFWPIGLSLFQGSRICLVSIADSNWLRGV
jgi:hypothetical protein